MYHGICFLAPDRPLCSNQQHHAAKAQSVVAGALPTDFKQSVGGSTGGFHLQHNTPYGDIVDSEEDLQIHLYDAVSYLSRALEIITNVLATMQINKELLHKRAGENFITATELADTFVREGGLTFRKAHKLTSTIVRRLYAEGKDAADITEEFCEEISKEVLGYPVDLSDEAIRTALDPVHFVAIRDRTGGPALSQASRMHRERLAVLQQEQ